LDPIEHHLTVKRTAHYCTLGHDIKDAEQVWIALHGYGQLASRFIRKFDKLDLTKHHIISPEALSHFYYKRSPSIVGASWMTSHQRLSEIEDYLSYLDQIYEKLADKMTAEQKLNIIGFSQGTTTMWRWISHSRPVLNSIVMWAGEYPSDVDYSSMCGYIEKIQYKFYCLGDQDEFITADYHQKLSTFADKQGLGFHDLSFSGAHRIDKKLLSKIADQL